MSSHSKSAAIIGLDSTMAFNHAALMFGHHHHHPHHGRRRASRKAAAPPPPSEPIDMTPPEERLSAFAVQAADAEDRHDFEAAVTARMHGVALAQLCFGKGHPEVTCAYARLACAYLRRGLYAQAEQHARAVLDRLGAIDHGAGAAPARFAAQVTLAQALVGQRQFAKAEPALDEARALIADAPALADRVDMMLVLAAVHTHKRFHGDAVEVLEQALNEKLGVVAATHPDMLALFLQLGRAYLKLATAADVDAAPDPVTVRKAIDVLTKAVAVGVANNFVYNQEMGDALFYLGVALAESGNSTTAIENFERSLRVYRQLHGKWSGPVCRALRQVAFLFVRQRQADGALQYLGLVIKAEGRLHGPNSQQVADLIKAKADVLVVAGRPDDAVPLFEDAAAIYETLFGTDCPQAGECRERIGRAQDQAEKSRP